MVGKLTARERGQRWRRKRERLVGKPVIGRPRGTRNTPKSWKIMRDLYCYLYNHGGHSGASAGAMVKRKLGKIVTEESKKLWRDNGLLNH